MFLSYHVQKQNSSIGIVGDAVLNINNGIKFIRQSLCTIIKVKNVKIIVAKIEYSKNFLFFFSNETNVKTKQAVNRSPNTISK